LSTWTARRRELAARYRIALAGARIDIPVECDPGHVYHLFVVRTTERDALRARLATAGIETLIHYPLPIPRQAAFQGFAPADCPVAARVCAEIVSLPLHPRMANEDVDTVTAAVLGRETACER
jgi:dTDP-3-amino-3,4,6-trideoxy-alpha-D-glucose transaminase